jgi:hypothetical protein
MYRSARTDNIEKRTLNWRAVIQWGKADHTATATATGTDADAAIASGSGSGTGSGTTVRAQKTAAALWTAAVSELSTLDS